MKEYYDSTVEYVVSYWSIERQQGVSRRFTNADDAVELLQEKSEDPNVRKLRVQKEVSTRSVITMPVRELLGDCVDPAIMLEYLGD